MSPSTVFYDMNGGAKLSSADPPRNAFSGCAATLWKLYQWGKNRGSMKQSYVLICLREILGSSDITRPPAALGCCQAQPSSIHSAGVGLRFHSAACIEVLKWTSQNTLVKCKFRKSRQQLFPAKPNHRRASLLLLLQNNLTGIVEGKNTHPDMNRQQILEERAPLERCNFNLMKTSAGGFLPRAGQRMPFITDKRKGEADVSRWHSSSYAPLALGGLLSKRVLRCQLKNVRHNDPSSWRAGQTSLQLEPLKNWASGETFRWTSRHWDKAIGCGDVSSSPNVGISAEKIFTFDEWALSKHVKLNRSRDNSMKKSLWQICLFLPHSFQLLSQRKWFQYYRARNLVINTKTRRWFPWRCVPYGADEGCNSQPRRWGEGAVRPQFPVPPSESTTTSERTWNLFDVSLDQGSIDSRHCVFMII